MLLRWLGAVVRLVRRGEKGDVSRRWWTLAAFLDRDEIRSSAG